MHLPTRVGAHIKAYRQLVHLLFHNRRIRNRTPYLPLALPVWARWVLLRVDNLRTLVSARLEDVPVELRAGLPTMLAGRVSVYGLSGQLKSVRMEEESLWGAASHPCRQRHPPTCHTRQTGV